MKLLIAEDDPKLLKSLIHILETNKFSVDGVNNGDDALSYGLTGEYDGLILDIMMPGMDGLKVLQSLRASNITTPALFLTARTEVSDRVEGLDAGADDYLPKPFGMMELIARVRALLRRAQVVDTEKEYHIGGLYMSPAKHLVRAEGRDVSLTLKEFEMLALLVENQGIVFTRDQLLTKIWGYAFDGESRTVDVHIRSLRQKLGSCGSLIETVRGIGYKIGEAKP